MTFAVTDPTRRLVAVNLSLSGEVITLVIDTCRRAGFRLPHLPLMVPPATD